MNTRIAALLTAAIFLSSCSASTSAAKKEKAAADFEQTAALIESGSYQFTIRSASPSGGYGDIGGIEFNGEPIGFAGQLKD